MEWYVVYTKPRWEKRVCREFEKLDIEAYCPMVTEIRQWSDRKKKIETPLFKSYVFVRLPAAGREKVFQAPGVVQFLYWLGKPAVVRTSEIETLKQWLDNGEVEDIETGHLTPGDQITIASGEFKGQEAIIKEIGNKRLRLVLGTMGFVVNVRLSEALEG